MFMTGVLCTVCGAQVYLFIGMHFNIIITVVQTKNDLQKYKPDFEY